MKTRCITKARNDKGSTMIFMVVAIALMFTAALLVLEVGKGLIVNAKMRTAADAAALAGAATATFTPVYEIVTTYDANGDILTSEEKITGVKDIKISKSDADVEAVCLFAPNMPPPYEIASNNWESLVSADNRDYRIRLKNVKLESPLYGMYGQEIYIGLESTARAFVYNDRE